MSNFAENKVNVAFLVYSMIGAGAERVVSILLEDLSEAFHIHLVLFNGPVEYAIPSNVQVHVLRREPRIRIIRLLTLPLVYFRYRRYCKNRQIAISLSFDNLANYVNAGLGFSGTWRGRIILSERNPPSVQFSNKRLFQFIHHFLIRNLYPKHHALIPCSKGVGLDLQQCFQLPVEYFYPIYNPLPVDKILELGNQPSDIPTDAFVFIHVGSFREQKNHVLLLHAFKQLNLPDTELWLIGKGPLQEQIRLLAEDMGIGHKVRFLGFQSNPYKYLRRAHCYVCASNYEGFPNVLLEAIACSLPVVSVDCKFGPREILAPSTDFRTQITEGIEIAAHGILTPVGRIENLTLAMLTLYADSELQLRFKRLALKRAREFDHVKISNEYADLLKKKLEM